MKSIQLTSKLEGAIYLVTYKLISEVRIIGKTYWFRYESGGCSFISNKTWAKIQAEMSREEEIDSRNDKYQQLISDLEDAKPRFVGSDKQRSWASSIYDAVAASLANDVVYGGQSESVLDALKETSASWWIDNRKQFGWMGDQEYRNHRRMFGCY